LWIGNSFGQMLVAPLLLALAGLAVVATTSVGTLGRSADRILRDNYRSVLAAQRMKEEVGVLPRLTVLLRIIRKNNYVRPHLNRGGRVPRR
jgi:hypothetical protein